MATRKQPAEERAQGSPVARVGRGRWQRDGPHAWRPEPLERGEGSVVGAAADREGLRRGAPPARTPPPGVGKSVRIERLLSGPQLDRNMLQVDPNARPRVKT